MVYPVTFLNADQTQAADLSWFPENHYSNGAGNATCSSSISRGRVKMSKSTVVICGLARSIAGILPRTIARIERTGSMFRNYTVFLVENDSNDTTAQQLVSWANRNRHVIIRSFNNNLKHYPSTKHRLRTSQLARLRNYYLRYLQSVRTDFAIILDTDLEVGWSYDGIASTFGNDDWDVVGSNSIIYRSYVDIDGVTKRMPIYYDAWAFRDDKGNSFDNGATRSPFPKSKAWVPCRSCFGGLAIYSARALADVQYGGEDCEHVVLHEQMRARGRDKIFVNPCQITVYNEETPKVTCIATADEQHPGRGLAITDFFRQTYANRELLLISPGAKLHSIVRCNSSGNEDDVAPALDYSEYLAPELRDKAVEFATGSLICLWNLQARHHPKRLEEQLKYINLSFAGACVIDGTLLYLLDSSEIFWIAHTNASSRQSAKIDLQLQSFMAYRHVAARSKHIYDTYSVMNDGALVLGCEEIAFTTLHVGGGCGGAWTTMQVSPTRSRTIEDLIIYKAMSSQFLIDNKAQLETILRGYEIQGPIRIMGHDGFAFTIT